MAENVKKLKKSTIIISVTTVILLVALLLYKAFGTQVMEIVSMLQRGDRDEIMGYLASQDSVSGYFYLFLLSLIQIVSVFLPCLVVQVAGALIFGWWKAFLSCWAGFVAGNMVVFIGMRMFGKGISFAFEKTMFKDNWLIRKLNSNNPVFAVVMACMIPGIPNGIIPYIAANTAISTKDFFYAITFSSWIQVVLNCIAGGFLAQGKFLLVLLAFGIEFVIIYFFGRYKDEILERFGKEE